MNTYPKANAGPHPVRYMSTVATATCTAMRICRRPRDGAAE